MTRRKILRVTQEGMRKTLTNDEVDDNHEFDYATDYSPLLLDCCTPTTIPLLFSARLPVYFFKFGQV